MEQLLQVIVPTGAHIKKTLMDYLVFNDLTSVYIIGAVGSAKNIRIAAPACSELPCVRRKSRFPSRARLSDSPER
jgi:hypothetical protein